MASDVAGHLKDLLQKVTLSNCLYVWSGVFYLQAVAMRQLREVTTSFRRVAIASCYLWMAKVLSIIPTNELRL